VPGGGYAPASFTIENSRINGNYFGIVADSTSNGGGTIRGVIKNSVVSGNTQNGITVSGGGGSDVLMVDGTTVSSNGNHGLVAGGSNAGSWCATAVCSTTAVASSPRTAARSIRTATTALTATMATTAASPERSASNNRPARRIAIASNKKRPLAAFFQPVHHYHMQSA
jgi:hypothetical protein